jgi:hypothetical protein
VLGIEPGPLPARAAAASSEQMSMVFFKAVSVFFSFKCGAFDLTRAAIPDTKSIARQPAKACLF